MPKSRRTRSVDTFRVDLTIEELDALLSHAQPPTTIESLCRAPRVTEHVVILQLTPRELDEFIQLIEGAANHAQNVAVQRTLGHALERIESALQGSVDRGAHLLRPSAISVGFSAKEGQYLAFIHQYQQLHGNSPAEADMQAYFGASPPAVHGMVLRLHRRRFISRTPGMPRSIRLLLRPDQVPPLDRSERIGRGLTSI